jgi:hypothetical protein
MDHLGLLQSTDEQAHPESSVPVAIALCCLTMILALLLGVGVPSNLVLRHLVQTAPLWIGVALGFRRSSAASWATLPLFLFWLFLMAMIWAYLLGFTKVLSGTFSRTEIAMTVIVGTAAVIGIASFVRFKSYLSVLSAGAWFVVMGAIQFACFRVSFLPEIAHR